MKKVLAQELIYEIDRLITAFNNPNREFYTGEEFKLKSVDVLSEYTAAVILQKNTGKQALVCAFHVKNKWVLFFLKESHAYGMNKFTKILEKVEENNFKYNFEEKVMKND